MTEPNRGLADWQRDALMVALGAVLGLADPDDPDAWVGSVHDGGEDDRHIREAVRPFLLSWVVEPLQAVLLGTGPVDPFVTGMVASVKGGEYLDGLRARLGL